jgi:hypothetical protein
MNRNLSILILFLVTIASCTKSADKERSLTSGLTGKWEYTETYFSIGGPGTWHPVQPGGQTIEFKPDGSFISVASFSGTFRHYEVNDSATVKFTPAPTSSGFVLMGYIIDSTEGSLLLYPVNPVCIEGCTDKFRRSGL